MLIGSGRRAARWLRRTVPRTPDAGFSLIEVVVAMGVIGVLMTSATVFFVQSLATVDRQRNRQAAIQVAGDAVETVFALASTMLRTGRDRGRTDAQWVAPVPGVAAHLAGSVPAVDTGATPGSTPRLPFTEHVMANGIRYTRHVYVGECWLAETQPGASCVSSADPGDVPFLRVVVAVTWPDRGCPARGCSYVTATLVGADVDDAIFQGNGAAYPPVIATPGAQRTDQHRTVSLRLRAVGGMPPLTWSLTGLPPGITATSGGFVTGAPTASGTSRVTATVTDVRNRSASVTFDWRVKAS
jgi:prepilin-type N-terminal cleavage/methylation domain-containing protein